MSRIRVTRPHENGVEVVPPGTNPGGIPSAFSVQSPNVTVQIARPDGLWWTIRTDGVSINSLSVICCEFLKATGTAPAMSV